MVSDRARAKISFSSLLADALRAANHEVARDAELHEDVDLVMVGLTSMLSPAATYSIVALGTLGRALKNDTPVVLFVDDPDMGKVRDAAASVRRDPDRLWSDFLAPKRVLASERHDPELVMSAVDLLGGGIGEWPTTMVPLHAWGRTTSLQQQLRIHSHVQPIDVSPVLMIQLMSAAWHRPNDAKLWLCEENYTPCSLSNGRTTWPILRSKNNPSWGTLDVYGTARAVHQEAVLRSPGWWTPTPVFAAHAGSVYLTGLEEADRLGGPYYLTVDQIESMDSDQHTALAADQYEHLKEQSWDLATLISTLEAVLGQSSSSERPDTTASTET